MPPVKPGTLTTDHQRKLIREAFIRLGVEDQHFAHKYGLNRFRLSRMINGKENVSYAYAYALNTLIAEAEAVRQAEAQTNN